VADPNADVALPTAVRSPSCPACRVRRPGSSEEGGWHATATIDVGSVEMYLPDLPPVTLRPGDTLILRGTNHLWRSMGDRSLRMVTVMLGVQSGP
jgi:hypothetical protein